MSFGLDEVSLLFFMVAIVSYITFFRSKRIKGKSRRDYLTNLYKIWARNRIKDSLPISAVQSLRNMMMAYSTFITSLLILLGLFVGLYNAENGGGEFFGVEGLTVHLMRFSLVMSLIIISLINFILGMRMLMRTTTLISVGSLDDEKEQQRLVENTERCFVSAQNHWMYGIRAFFFMIISFSWYLNDVVFIIATAGILIYLIHLDVGLDVSIFK